MRGYTFFRQRVSVQDRINNRFGGGYFLMAIYRYGDRVPRIGQDSFVSDTAVVIGDVIIGDNCYIGHGSILREIMEALNSGMVRQ